MALLNKPFRPRYLGAPFLNRTNVNIWFRGTKICMTVHMLRAGRKDCESEQCLKFCLVFVCHSMASLTFALTRIRTNMKVIQSRCFRCRLHQDSATILCKFNGSSSVVNYFEALRLRDYSSSGYCRGYRYRSNLLLPPLATRITIVRPLDWQPRSARLHERKHHRCEGESTDIGGLGSGKL